VQRKIFCGGRGLGFLFGFWVLFGALLMLLKGTLLKVTFHVVLRGVMNVEDVVESEG